jgi:DNA-binding IclR family transcriptional regulator
MKITTSHSKLPGYQAPAVHKAFKLLRAVAESPRHLGLTELALQLGFSKSTAHGLVHALLREGALTQGPNGRKLFLGPTVVDLAFSSWNYLKMVESVQSTIELLRDQIKETLVLGTLICNRILIMAAAESTEPLKISVSPGTALPLFAGAAGKVFLATKPTDDVKQLIGEKGLPRYTPRSIVDEQAYLSELEQVRLKGHSVDDEEYLTGVRAVAVSLQNIKGAPMAVWAVGLSSSMGTDKIENTIDIMTGSVEKLRTTLEKASGY